MRFLPVFLDLHTGPVLLIGAGDLARAKLRLLAAAGARGRWYATDGDHYLSRLSAAGANRSMAALANFLCDGVSGNAWSMAQLARWFSPAAEKKPKRR